MIFPFQGILLPGDMKMKTNKDILGSVLKTTQMGQTGIRSVLKMTPGTEMKQALCDQLKEYDCIEAEAYNIASDRGWILPELPQRAKTMSQMMSRAMLLPKCTDSRIASMMIKGSTKGVIKGLKNDHRYEQRDPRIEALSKKLLDCENQNIRQMENFL